MKDFEKFIEMLDRGEIEYDLSCHEGLYIFKFYQDNKVVEMTFHHRSGDLISICSDIVSISTPY